jgi:hypothetical protein
MTDISQKGSNFVRDLGDAAQRNPVSAALIGMGVIWLFTGNRPVKRAGDVVRAAGLDRIPDVAGEALQSARSSLRSGVDTISDSAGAVGGALRDGGANVLDGATQRGRDYANAASEYVSALPESGAELFGTVRSNLSEVFRTQPLALGAVGLAIGAGIAATLPASEIEASYLGEASDSVKATAAEFAAKQTDRVTAVAGNVLQAVSDEARSQGLTFEGAKAAAADLSEKIGRVAEGAGKGIADRAKLGR